MKPLKLILLLGLLTAANSSFATVFYSKSEAMELAFGKGTPVEQLGLFTFYIGKNQDKITGYAAIETNTVRTKPETLMIVLTPEGELQKVYTLAFHEPPEYMPPERWFEQLYKRPLADMDFNKGVDGIAGAKLSTRANIDSIRKVMAIYQVLVKK
ncbi:MAG: FMN-binding protein [Methylococcales bacterium]|nr:FMN-binding protein [Methylococcales bacterium]